MVLLAKAVEGLLSAHVLADACGLSACMLL